MTTERRAKLFRNGRSQAVRLPKEFQLPGEEVRIHREGTAVVLEPLEEPGWPQGHWERLAALRRGLDLESLRRPADPPPAPLRDEVEP
jgi:antitoxin VapB